MVVASGRPRVITSELDAGVTVGNFPGVYVGTVVQSKKGKIGEAVLNTNIDQYLKRYTFRSQINIGDDLAHYGIIEALKNNNKVYTVRAARNALYGGVYFKQDYPITGLSVSVTGSASPYTVFEVSQTNQTNADLFYDSLYTGDIVRFTATGLPTGITGDTDYYVIKLSEYQFMVASSYQNALDGIPVEMTTTGDTIVCNLYPNAGSSLSNDQIEYGISNPDNYVFDTSSGKELNSSSEFSIDTETDIINVSSEFYNALDDTVGDTVLLTATTFPTVATGDALDDVTSYYVINYDTDKIQLARTLEDATAGTYINFTSNGVDLAGTLENKINVSAVTPANATDDFTVSDGDFYTLCETGDKVTYANDDTYPTVDAGDAFDGVTTYYIIKSTTNKVKLARTLANANAGVAIGFSTDGAGTHTFTLTEKDESSDFIVDLRSDDVTVDSDFYEQVRTPNKVSLSTNNTLPSYELNGSVYVLSDSVSYYVIRGSEANTINLALSESNARLGIAINLINNGVGTHTIQIVEDNEQLYGVDRKCLLLLGTDQGAYNNELYVETLHYPYGDSSTWTATQKDQAALVGENNSFIIYVYRKENDGTYTTLEEWLVSRDPDKIDARGVNIYVETVLEGSNFIKAVNNTEVDKNTLPINQTSKLQFAFGSDGDAVTTTDMINMVNLYSNPRDLEISVIPDLGFSIPAYQKAIVEICEARLAFCSLSVPLSDQLSATAAGNIVDYRREDLNVDSSFAGLWSVSLIAQDQFNNREIYVDPTGYITSTIGKNANTHEYWTPPAGKYGILNVIDVACKLKPGEQDDLYNNQINFAENIPGKGIRFGGQKTLYSRNSPLSRINVRLVINVFEKLGAEFLEEFKYSISNEALWNNIRSGLSNKLDDLVNRNGIEEYFVKCDDENNTLQDRSNNILNVDVIIRPAFVVEYIRFRNIIVSGSVNISYDIIKSLT